MQMTYLEEWSLMDRDHSNALSGAIEALKATTLRLPVVGGAKVRRHPESETCCWFGCGSDASNGILSVLSVVEGDVLNDFLCSTCLFCCFGSQFTLIDFDIL
ncbi:hypothetical protein B296_00049061 [Ensete ventricosum]|uniref:Uncharacterized protein n=1 Tax=Ensete ventricosum TaxID=4639 RepID=A0A426YDS5_ENSVE|nr:hypothetical protein B296_00049061 [Ensete ventricosum]